MSRKKALLGVLGTPVLLVAVAAGIGATLPVAHTASLSRTLAAPPERVWAVVTDPAGFPSWRPDVDDVTVLEDRGGFSVWVETSASGSMTIQVTELQPPRRMVTRIADEGLPFGGTWTYELAPEGSGSRLRITENGEIYNPVFRFAARFVLGYEGTLLTYLDALESRLAQAALILSRARPSPARLSPTDHFIPNRARTHAGIRPCPLLRSGSSPASSSSPS